MKIKEEYDKLKGKYYLPIFEEINNEFEISTIENEEFLLREIRRKIGEKIEEHIKILESLLQPDTVSLSDLYEYRFFSDEERKDIFKLFRDLVSFHRFSIETSINENNKKTSGFINSFWKEWPQMKSEFLVFIKKIKEDWLKETKIIDDDKGGYLG